MTEKSDQYAIDPNRSLKLRLGCGERDLPGFVQVDIQPLPKIDVATPLQDLHMFPDDCADLIYHCVVLEHIGRWETVDTLKECHEC